MTLNISSRKLRRPAVAGCRQGWGRIAHLKVLKEDHATSIPDDSATQIIDPWRADIQWLGGWLRSHVRSHDSLLLLRGLVTIG